MSPDKCSVEAVVASIDQVLADLGHRPLSSKKQEQGWTEESRENMVQLLGEWKSEIEGAGQLSPRHFRVIARFFDDLDIESSTGVAARIIKIDLAIYDCTHDHTSSGPKSAAMPTGMSEQDRLWIRKLK
jgi:hypothetical protein